MIIYNYVDQYGIIKTVNNKETAERFANPDYSIIEDTIAEENYQYGNTSVNGKALIVDIVLKNEDGITNTIEDAYLGDKESKNAIEPKDFPNYMKKWLDIWSVKY